MELENLIIMLDWIAILYVILFNLITFIYIVSSSINFSRNIKLKKFEENLQINNKRYYPPVSLIVPAYNESLTICDTIESLAILDYKQYEIIIVSDGSTDESIEIIKNKYKLKEVYRPTKINIETKKVNKVYMGSYMGRKIILIDKENGGKADALNVGINYSSYPIFVAIDADSILVKDSLRKIIDPFMRNRKVVAVGGNIKISNHLKISGGKIEHIENPRKFIVSLQIIEYMRSFLTNRVAWNMLNMNLIISGAFGAFNKQVVIDVGGYDSKTVGEDMELVMRIHKHFIEKDEKYYIMYSTDANCYTQAPESFKSLKSQRRRWQVGLIHCMGIHRKMFLNGKWLLAKLYFLGFEMITPIVEVIGIITITISFILGIINLEFLMVYYFMIIIYGLAVSVAAILMELYVYKEHVNKKLLIKLMILSIFEPISYRLLISIYRISAFLGYKKNKHKWGNIKRVKNN